MGVGKHVQRIEGFGCIRQENARLRAGYFRACDMADRGIDVKTPSVQTGPPADHEADGKDGFTRLGSIGAPMNMTVANFHHAARRVHFP